MAELIAASSALGVVASLISFGDVAWKVVSRLKEYNTQFEDAPQILRKIGNQLPLLHENISKWKEETEAGAVIIDDGTALKVAIIGCDGAIKSLGLLLEKVLPKKTESKVTRMMKALKSVRYESEISKIWADVESYRDTLTFHFTHRAPETPRETSHRGDLSLASTVAYYRFPNRLVKHFVDRALDEIPLTDRIDKYFTLQNNDGPNRSRVVVLLGMGGAGKSQIALRYCEHAKNGGYFKVIFWVDASSAASVAKAFADIARALTGSQLNYGSGVAEMVASISNIEKDSPVSVEQTIESVKAIIQGLDTPWMFVFDNYDQPDEFQFHGRFKSIRDYWPTGANGLVLITSRHESCERLGQTFRVGRMSNKEACRLLLSHIEDSDEETQMEAAVDVVELLGCLALAIDQAGAYIRSQRLKISYYPDHYQSRKKHVLARIPSGLEWEYRREFGEVGKDTALSIFTTWELSLQCLGGDELETERKTHFLTVAAFFNTFNIQEDLFRRHFNHSPEKSDWMALFSSNDNWDSYKFGDLVTELKGLSILESLDRNEQGSCLTFHPLVGEWIRTRLTPLSQDFYATEAVMILHNNLPKRSQEPSEEKDTADLQALVPHVTQCLRMFTEYHLPEHILGTGDLEAPILSFISFLSDCAMFDEAEKIVLDALRWKEQHNMPWTKHFLDVGMHLVWVYREKGNRELITKWTTEIYTRCLELLGDEDSLTLSCQSLWGLMHVDRHDLEEAAKILEANYEKYCSVLGPDSVRTAQCQGNLAIVYQDLGKTSEAISYMTNAFHTTREKRGPDYLPTLRMQSYLISLIKNQKPDEALSLALDCVSRMERQLGISHPRTIRAYFVLSKVYHQLDRFSDNRTVLKMIQKVYETFNVARGEIAGELYGLLGFSYLDDDENIAEQMFAQSVAAYKELNELHTLNGLICVSRVTHIYARRGEYGKAEDLWEESISSYDQSGIQLTEIDERLYMGYYKILLMQNFLEDASRKAEIRNVAERAMQWKSVTESWLAYQRHLSLIQVAYSFLEEPDLADGASYALLELGVWRFGTEGRPSQREEAKTSYELAVQVPLPMNESKVDELEE